MKKSIVGILVVLFFLLTAVAIAHVCNDVKAGGDQAGCPDPETVKFISTNDNQNRISIVAQVTAKHITWGSGTSCLQANGCYKNSDFGGKCNPTTFTSGFTLNSFQYDVQSGSRNYLTFSSSPAVPMKLSDGQTQTFNIYVDVSPTAPSQHFTVDIQLLGSLSSESRPIFILDTDWSGSSCSDTCASLGFACGTHSVCGASKNCGTCSAGSSCNTAGKCVASCTDTCTSLGYQCGTQTVCGTAKNCGACPAGQSCNAGVCSSSCNNQCALGAKQCSGSGYVSCADFNSDGCYEWGSTVYPCAAVKCQAASCSGGACSLVNVLDGSTDSVCHDTVGCTGGSCVCNGAGSCVSRPSCSSLCSLGSRQCSGSGYVSCADFNSDGCYEWGSTVYPCAAVKCQAASCSGGACSLFNVLDGSTDSVCHDTVGCTGGSCVCNGAGSCVSRPSCSSLCSLGSRQCSGSGYVSCADFNSDGCYEWGAVVACPTGQSCSSGVCASTCSNECSASGLRMCSGSGYLLCGNFDSDTCLEWGSLTSCPSAACRNAVCSGAGVCGTSNLADGLTDSSCSGSLGCTGGSCVCNGAGLCVSRPPCAQTCTTLGIECGMQSICGISTNCGSCATGFNCIAGECVSICGEACSTYNYTCGTHTICGQSMNCGTCTAGYSCVSGKCQYDAQCTDECSTAGSRHCSNNTAYQICNDFNSDSCFEWGAINACPDAICKSPQCQGNGTCGYLNILANYTDEACHDAIGCIGGSCKCDGNGNCASRPAQMTGASVCGNNIIQAGEACDGNTNTCTLSGNNGIQYCKNDCSGFGNCLVSGGSSTSCTPNWICTNWGPCEQEGVKTRICSDVGNCNDDSSMPSISMACQYSTDYTQEQNVNPLVNTNPVSEQPANTAQAEKTAVSETGNSQSSTTTNYAGVIGLIVGVVIVGLIIALVAIKASKKNKASDSGNLSEQEIMLQNYIQQELANNYSKEQIRQALLVKGWNQETVDKMMNKFR